MASLVVASIAEGGGAEGSVVLSSFGVAESGEPSELVAGDVPVAEDVRDKRDVARRGRAAEEGDWLLGLFTAGDRSLILQVRCHTSTLVVAINFKQTLRQVGLDLEVDLGWGETCQLRLCFQLLIEVP